MNSLWGRIADCIIGRGSRGVGVLKSGCLSEEVHV